MKSLFDSTAIGSMSLKNRLWRSATWMKMADEKGHLTERLEKVYLDLAEGGVGTIITGYTFVMEDEQPNPGMTGIYNDSFIPEYKALTDKVHGLGANIVMQIVYGGSSTTFNTEDRLIWGPSAVEHPRTKVTPTAMTTDDIATLVAAFAAAAGRVKAAGFDGVQFHGAHNYMFGQFLTPFFNRRDDAYGGPIENRGRLIFEALEAVRGAVGPDYPVFIKMHCTDDWDEGGLTEDESLYMAQELEKRGISGIEFSGGTQVPVPQPNTGTIRKGILKQENQSYFAETTARIAKHLNIPVISVGGNRNPDKMEQILNDTTIDYFSMARPLLSEPALVNRWEQGDRSEPRCVACIKCFDADGNCCVLDREKKEEVEA